MYMDENDVRNPRERADGELLRRLLAEEREHHHGCMAVPYRGGGHPSRGCDGSPRGCVGIGYDGSCRGEIQPRNENALNGDLSHGCHCGHTNACGSVSGEIGNRYPCGENGVTERSLAMVYAPIQYWRDAYEPEMALKRGTLFRELDMPFYGKKRSGEGGNCYGR